MKLLGHSGHIDEKNDALINIYLCFISLMDDLDMTFSDFVHALKMLICSEKHPVSRANHAHTKKVVTDR